MRKDGGSEGGGDFEKGRRKRGMCEWWKMGGREEVELNVVEGV